MKILFLEIDRVLSFIGNDKDDLLFKLKSDLIIDKFNSLLLDNDYRIVFTTKDFNSLTEKQAFSYASKLGLPLHLFITKIDVSDNVLSDISKFLETRDDVDSYFIINTTTNITTYSPYVYTSIGLLRTVDIEAISSAMSSLNNIKKKIENDSTNYFKEEMNNIKKKQNDELSNEVLLQEISELIKFNPDKYCNHYGYRLLVNNYKTVDSDKIKDMLIKSGAKTKTSVMIFKSILPTLVLTIITTFIIFCLTHNTYSLFFSIPVFLLIYSIITEYINLDEYL